MIRPSAASVLRSAVAALAAAFALAACKGNVQSAYTASDAAHGAPGVATNGVAPAAAPGTGNGYARPGTTGAMSDTGQGAQVPAAGAAAAPGAAAPTGGTTAGAATRAAARKTP